MTCECQGAHVSAVSLASCKTRSMTAERLAAALYGQDRSKGAWHGPRRRRRVRAAVGLHGRQCIVQCIVKCSCTRVAVCPGPEEAGPDARGSRLKMVSQRLGQGQIRSDQVRVQWTW